MSRRTLHLSERRIEVAYERQELHQLLDVLALGRSLLGRRRGEQNGELCPDGRDQREASIHLRRSDYVIVVLRFGEVEQHHHDQRGQSHVAQPNTFQRREQLRGYELDIEEQGFLQGHFHLEQ